VITFKKTFDFYATDEQLDAFVSSILDRPEFDDEDKIQVEHDWDIDHRYVTLKVYDRVLN